MLRRKRILAAVFVAMAVALVLVLRSRTSASATAPDARRVTVEKITYGTKHSFTLGKAWVRVLKPVLGTRWAARHGCVKMQFTNAEPALMVWTRWSGVSITNPLSLEATILDEHGTESELVLSRWNESDARAHTNRFDSTSYVGWIFRNYPRRSRSLSLRIYDRDTDYRPIPVVQISFPNPAPKRYPRWTGRQAPVSRTNEGAVFTLEEVNGADALWNDRFQVTTNGLPDASWQVASLQATDATGNIIGARTNVMANAHLKTVFTLRGALWPDERARRLSVEFCRAFDFSTNELWTTPPLDVLPFTTAAGPITNSSVNGHIVVVKVFDPGQAFLLAGSRANGVAWVSLETNPVPACLMLVRAQDDLGREVEHKPVSVTPDHKYVYDLFRPTGGRAVRLTFAVRQSTIIDFDVAAESVLPQSKTAP
jgi:hypothetical protein